MSPSLQAGDVLAHRRLGDVLNLRELGHCERAVFQRGQRGELRGGEAGGVIDAAEHIDAGADRFTRLGGEVNEAIVGGHGTRAFGAQGVPAGQGGVVGAVPGEMTRPAGTFRPVV